MDLNCLPMFREVNAINLPEDSDEVVLVETDKNKLEALSKALPESKSSNKRTYASWTRHI